VLFFTAGRGRFCLFKGKPLSRRGPDRKKGKKCMRNVVRKGKFFACPRSPRIPKDQSWKEKKARKVRYSPPGKNSDRHLLKTVSSRTRGEKGSVAKKKRGEQRRHSGRKAITLFRKTTSADLSLGGGGDNGDSRKRKRRGKGAASFFLRREGRGWASPGREITVKEGGRGKLFSSRSAARRNSRFFSLSSENNASSSLK